MVQGSVRWTDVLGCCREAFQSEPILEMALGGVYREVYGKYVTEDVAHRNLTRGAVKSAIYPFFFMLRSMLLRYDLERRTVARGVDAPGDIGIFVITEPRDNNFACIYPVLKRYDELGHRSMLFISEEAWVAKRPELVALRHCRIVILNLLKYTSGAMSGFRVRAMQRSYLKDYESCCRDARVKGFVEGFRPFLRYELMDLLHTAGAIEEALKAHKCRFILTMGVPPGEFRWALAGKRLGIRTYIVSHGFIAAHRLSMHFSPSNSDEIILWGPISEPEVRKVCGPDHPVSVLGNPAYDTLVNDYLHKEPDPSVLIPLGFRRDALSIVFYSGTHAITGDDEKHIAPIRALRAVKRTFGDRVNVVVKLHPHEGREHYERHLGEDIGGFIIVKGELPLFQLMGLADVAASIDSTTLVEAMVMGVPTLQLSLSEHGVVADYHEHGATILVRKEDELLGLIERALSGDASMWTGLKEAQKDYVAQYLVNLGTATERYVKHLLATDGGDVG